MRCPRILSFRLALVLFVVQALLLAHSTPPVRARQPGEFGHSQESPAGRFELPALGAWGTPIGGGPVFLRQAPADFNSTAGLRWMNDPGAPAGSLALIFPVPVDYDSGGFRGNWVAVGDVNGDGIPDLVVVNYGSNSVGVLLGNGDGTFGAAASYWIGGDAPSAVAIGDLNGDGIPDLVVASVCMSSSYCSVGAVSVLLGNGDGTFQLPTVYNSGGDGTNAVAVRDVNGDGKPDVVVANLCAPGCNGGIYTGMVGVLVGSGDGTLQPVVNFATGGTYATAMAVADVNGDGKLDLVVGNNGTSSVGVLLGNGDGTFQPAVSYGSGASSPSAVAVADVNHDGKLDVLVANYYSECCSGDGVMSVLLGNGDGTFQAANTYDSGGSVPTSVAVADVNGDGNADLIVVNAAQSNGMGSGDVAVLLGNGDATFQRAVVYLSGGFGSKYVVAADVNGDDKPDLLVANWCTTEPHGLCTGDGAVAVLLNNSGATATTTTVISSGSPAALRQTVTYTATVASQPGATLNGTVTFRDGYAAIATVTLNNNQAAYSTVYKTVGAHTITASYWGVFGDFEGSLSAPLTEYVHGPSKTAVVSSESPAQTGQPVTFTATVTSRYGAIPDGELVTFSWGKTTLGTSTTMNSVASLTTSFSKAKTYDIKAAYSGDNLFEPSSGSVRQVVEK